MAVMDQDNFSNLSFHSDQHAAGSSSAVFGGHEPESPGVIQQQQQSQQPDSHIVADPQVHDSAGGEILECTVTEPHTENAGTKDAYVSYLITTNVGTRQLDSSC